MKKNPKIEKLKIPAPIYNSNPKARSKSKMSSPSNHNDVINTFIEDIISTNHIICRNALKRFEQYICQVSNRPWAVGNVLSLSFVLLLAC